MKDIIEKLKKDKKTLIIGVVALLAIIALVVILLVLPKDNGKGNNNGGNNDGNGNSSVDLEKNLTEAGKNFYETQYYVGLEDPTTLANFKDTGLNISITNLEVILPLDEATKKELTNKECDLDETKIIIYPKDPYGVENHEIKVELSCKK